MSIQLPGSVLSRALRSRLVQQRLVRTTAYHHGRYLAPSVHRLYSTAFTDAGEARPDSPLSSPPIPMHGINLAADDANLTSEDGNLADERVASNPRLDSQKPRMSRQETERLKTEGKMLLEIARGPSPGVDRAGASHGRASVNHRQIVIELEWLQDRRALADRVARLMQSGDQVKAVALVRKAQKDGRQCDMVWNRILQYCMDKGHALAAFKFYNDMKKRGGKPNSRTITIMLHGYSNVPGRQTHQHPAYSIYRSLFSPNSPVEANIIHTNAMLRVCQRHNNLDLMWRIAGELPEEGPQAPDITTYSIILGALQYASRHDIAKEGLDDKSIDRILKRKEQLIKDGKRIWADVIYRWTNTELPIDNGAVNAMASLLLDGATDRDFYDVLALYHQTMGVPILTEVPAANPKGARRRVITQKKLELERNNEETEDVPFVDEDNNLLTRGQKQPPAKAAEEDGEEVEENFDSLFDPVEKSENLSYPRAGSKELTLILDACMNMTQGPPLGSAYWERLTRESTTHRIEPDTLAFVQYLRLLRITRSSRLAARLMREQMIPSGQANGKAFHIALACCRRDRRNLRVLLHANELLDLMNEVLILPDPRVLEGYLDLIQILSAQPHVLLYLAGLDDGGKKSDRGSLQTLGKELQTKLRLRALETLRPHYVKLHEAMQQGEHYAKTRWTNNREFGPILGQTCVSLMARIRTLIDELLKVEYMSHVSKGERKTFQVESDMLKTYSDKATIQNFAQRLVSPTVDQLNDFRVRQAQARAQEPQEQPQDQGAQTQEAQAQEVQGQEPQAQESQEQEASVQEPQAQEPQAQESQAPESQGGGEAGKSQ